MQTLNILFNHSTLFCYHESSSLTSHLSNATPSSGLKLYQVPPLSSNCHMIASVTNQCHWHRRTPPLAGPHVTWPPSVTSARCHRSPSQWETEKLSPVSPLQTNGRTSGQAAAGTELDLQSPALSITVCHRSNPAIQTSWPRPVVISFHLWAEPAQLAGDSNSRTDNS